VVDQGPFADSLDRYAGRPGYDLRDEDLGGRPGRVVRFRSDDGATYTVCAQVPDLDRLTVVVTADRSVPEQVPLEIVRSIRQST